MNRSPDPGKPGRPRPLPSVNMALLPHERQAERARRVAWVAVAALALGTIAVLVLHPYLFAPLPLRPSSRATRPPAHAPLQTAMLAATAQSPAPPATHRMVDAGQSNTDVDGQNTAAEEAAQPATDEDAVPGRTVAPLHLAAVSAPADDETAAPDDAGSPSDERTATTTATDSAAASAEDESDNAADTTRPSPGTRKLRFGNAAGFQQALLNANIPFTDSAALVAALDPHMDFRRCRPEDQLRVSYDNRGTVQAFEYRASQTERYRAVREDGHFVAERIPVALETRRVTFGGYVDISLGQALEQLAVGSSLVGAFVEAFEREVSFQRDTRTGDRFRLIADQRLIDGKPTGYGTVHALEYHGERVGKLRAYWYDPREGRAEFFDEKGRGRVGGWLRTPLRYDFISSPFNPRRRHPILKRIVPHHGVDYVAATGTPVWAAADGTVTFTGAKGPNGNLISIRHTSGYETHYAHLSRIKPGLRPGKRVEQRTLIGAVGTTGRSTGPHLHFGLERYNRFIDPQSQLNGPGKLLSRRERSDFKRLRDALDGELDAIPLSPAPSKAAARIPASAAFLPADGPVEL